ncbi:heptaprenyl diphosphate synthase component 1 [Alkalihalobacillus sp. LMS39]|uniref:heptaprenyl diphosphate synthase component 1 n=1 Tax=Alkalihalobacillus sp. LMS39 TaxID=2924032 RepID=UPI001FB4BE5C|nr:heptaprenyl diphosphate synthase component 1 [Alkalihalobacillus sp. LMS39]UOE92346.1 heptaprenyl diphosphate synthase component 1 [Alkalihalobacillus sp. LMS39]
MKMRTFLDENVNECIAAFYSMTDHPFLKQYSAKPSVDKDKLRFLFAMLESKIPIKKLQAYALSAILVDAALDAHENVSLQPLNSDFIKKTRQLTVLAGDYYSSLYYYLLADEGDIDMIRIFSYSIQKINEHKMNVYKNDGISFEQWKQDLSIIESELIQNIALFYKLDAWKETISEYFFLKRLILERSQIKANECPVLLDVIVKHDNRNADTIEQMINEKVFATLENLTMLVKKHEFKDNFISDFIEQVIASTTIVEEKVAEEG